MEDDFEVASPKNKEDLKNSTGRRARSIWCDRRQLWLSMTRLNRWMETTLNRWEMVETKMKSLYEHLSNIYASNFWRSRIPFMRRWTSRTASTICVSGVSCVFRIGAVFTSTCQGESAWAGSGFCVFGSIYWLQRSVLSEKRIINTNIIHLKYLYWDGSSSKYIASLI